MSGLSEEEAKSRFVLCSKYGAIGKFNNSGGDNPHYNNDGSTSDSEHIKFANDVVDDGTSLLNTIKEFKPNVLLG